MGALYIKGTPLIMTDISLEGLNLEPHSEDISPEKTFKQTGISNNQSLKEDELREKL